MKTRFYGNGELRDLLDVAHDKVKVALEQAITDTLGEDCIEDESLIPWILKNL